MKNKNKIVTSIVAISMLSVGLLGYSSYTKNSFVQNILASMGYGENVIVNAQNATPFVTVKVEKYTTNKLPNITGTCSIGSNMNFTIKKGATGIVSETFSKLCDVSPYTTNPTIMLPDGKYRVDVKIGVAPINPCSMFSATGSIINGTTGDEDLSGTAGDDAINGNGGNDLIFGGAGNDTLFAGSLTDPTGGVTYLYGDGGCDKLTGGSQLNLINGTNSSLKGVGEQDTLTGGGSGSVNIFELSGTCPDADYYIGNGNGDFAFITNFDPAYDVINLSNLTTSIGSYTITFSNGVSSLYYNGDLMAKINSTSILDINASYFNGQCGNR